MGLSSLRHRLSSYRARRALSPLGRQVIDERLTYLSPAKMAALESLLADLERDKVEGSAIEAGVALGGSGIVLASSGREFHGYDVFAQIPPPGDEDPPEVHERFEVIARGDSQGIDGDDYYGYRDDLFEAVSESFDRFGLDIGGRVQLHQGLFEDTLLPDGPVAIAHIDCDWYEPVKVTLERIAPYLSPGGIIVSDDYHTYSGAKKAVDEFRREHPDYEVLDTRADSLVLRRSVAPSG